MADAGLASVFARIKREAGDPRVADLYSRRAEDLRGGLFPEQQALIDDPHRFKAACCTRRAGKSTCSIHYMVIVACATPEANVQYVTLTGKKARKEIWPELKRVCRRYDLEVKPNEQTMTVYFSNGSVINLDGCEDIGDVDKYRGSDGGYDLVVIDECKSFEAAMFAELVDEAIVPALGDRMGTLLIIGTPGRYLSGRFYEITCDRAASITKRRDPVENSDTYSDEYEYATSRPYAQRDAASWRNVAYAWSFHRWYTKDNVAKPHIWLEQLATKRRNGWRDDEPIWRREYRGEWVSDDSGYVYAYLSERNDWEPDPASKHPFGLPDEHDWIYIEGCDLGFDDDFAIEVVAWSETTTTFYMGVHEVAMPGMDVPAIAKALGESEALFGEFHARTGDRGGLGKTIFATLANQYGIHIEAADKHEKRDFQELLNSELRAGRAKVRKGSKLARQMGMLQWKPDGKTEDKGSSPKDACDAGLYSWRYIYSAYSKPRDVPPAPNTEDFVRARADDAKKRVAREATSQSLRDRDDHWQHDRRVDSDDGERDDGEWHR